MSKKQLTTLLAALAILGALVGAHLQSKEHSYTVYRGFNDQVLKTLEAQGVTFHWEGRNLILTTRDRRHLLASLSIATESQEYATRVYYQNRGNRTTTRTVNGQPYRRLSPAFDEEGVFAGVTVDSGDFFWSKDPDHPDAVVAGPHAGYVPYPNVCEIKEQALITEAGEQVRKLYLAMANVDPEMQGGKLQSGMFAMMGSGDDPFSPLNFFLSFQQEPVKPVGHQCTTNCIPLPSEFKVIEKTSPR
jgi:flagellar basal body rod protein FlgC